MFLGIAALLCVVAGAVVVWPFLWGGKLSGGKLRGGKASFDQGADADRRRVNELLFQEASRDLTQVLNPEDPDDAEVKEALILELGARLIDDENEIRAENDEPDAANAQSEGMPGGRAVGWIGGAMVPVLAVFVYLVVGEPAASTLKGFDSALTQKLAPEELTDLVGRLRERLLDEPGEAKTWYLLGHTLMRQERFAEAGRAFASAHEHGGPDSNIDIYWLQAKYLASGGVLDNESAGLLDRVARSQPDHPLVLEILALRTFQSGDMVRAVGFLERAIGSAGGGERANSLIRALEVARQRMGGDGRHIDVAVSASEAPPPGSTLFVVARPVGGGMPYAVVRRAATLLPMTVRLDDAVSMSPTNPLSGATRVEVVARISRSGRAMAEAGDWRWQSVPLDVAKGPQVDAILAPPLTRPLTPSG